MGPMHNYYFKNTTKRKDMKEKKNQTKEKGIYIYISVCVGKKISCFLIEKSNQHHMIRLLIQLLNLLI